MHIKFSSITYHNAGNKTGFRFIFDNGFKVVVCVLFSENRQKTLMRLYCLGLDNLINPIENFGIDSQIIFSWIIISACLLLNGKII